MLDLESLAHLKHMSVVGRLVGDLVHDRMHEVNAAAVIIERVAWLNVLLDIKALAEIEDLDEQVLLNDADFDVHFFGRVAFIGVQDCVGHCFGQHQVQVVGKFFPVATVVAECARNVFADMTDQAEVARLVGYFYVDCDPVSCHDNKPECGLRFPLPARLLLEAGQGFAGVCIDLKHPVQTGQFKHRFNLQLQPGELQVAVSRTGILKS